MKRKMGKVLLTSGLMGAWVILVGGCVSQQKYDELMRTHRICNDERVRLGSDLANALADKQKLQSDLEEANRNLAGKDAMIAALQGSSDSSGDALRQLTKLYDELVKTRITDPIQIVPLPPELDKALKEFAAKYPEAVQYDSARGVLKFVSDVLFDLGSDEVKATALSSLGEFAGIINSPAASDFDLVIVGHTDNKPIARPETRAKHPTNWHLSVHRAIAVMKVFNGDAVSEDRMGVMGYGEFRPLTGNDTADGRSKNRRVEIFLTPKHTVGTVKSKAAMPEAPALQEK
jgi:chemotaxis protein MotB